MRGNRARKTKPFVFETSEKRAEAIKSVLSAIEREELLKQHSALLGGAREVSDDVLSPRLFRVRDSRAHSTGPAGWGCDQSAGLNYSRLTDKEAVRLKEHNIRERAERPSIVCLPHLALS